MKKFILKSLLFIVLFLGMDYVSGYLFLLNDSASSGRLYKAGHLSKYFSEDILVLGSSRAARHYNSNLIKNSMGMTCFNAGFDGHGIINAYPFFKMAVQNHVPRIIVYDLTPEVDYLNNDNIQYATYIRIFHNNPVVKDVIRSISPLEALKYNSNIYCLNSQIPQLMIFTFMESDTLQYGFEPLDGEIDLRLAYYNEPRDASALKLDSVKLKYMDRLIVESREIGIDFYLVISPEFDHELDCVEYADTLAQKYNVPLLNHIREEGFRHNSRLFYDRTHLNKRGADSLSNLIIQEITSRGLR